MHPSCAHDYERQRDWPTGLAADADKVTIWLRPGLAGVGDLPRVLRLLRRDESFLLTCRAESHAIDSPFSTRLWRAFVARESFTLPHRDS